MPEEVMAIDRRTTSGMRSVILRKFLSLMLKPMIKLPKLNCRSNPMIK